MRRSAMKRIVTLVVALASLWSCVYGSSERKKLGIGVVLGAPTGFSVKYWQSQRVAYQGSIGGMYKGGLMIGADYLVHENALKNPDLPFYYGAGLFIGNAGFGGPEFTRGSFALGVRGAFGLDYLVPGHPFDISVELGPALLLTPVVGMGIELSIALRFYP
ncbi:MAG TPA: hypothetical protein DEP53_03200 [Bacteroidetes bacterium]|nr:hypothetical protein [Bacteroidota bacterium]